MAKASVKSAKKPPPKAPPKAAPAPSRAVATREAPKTDLAATADDELLKMMAQDSGRGVSTAVEDNVVPLVYILQAQSPQVVPQKPEYIDGATAGMIWFRGTTDIVSGEEGIPVVPCHFSKSWVEWLPNRGGFVTRHDDRPDDAVLTQDPQNVKRKYWKRPNGNTVVETREHVVIVLDVFDRPSAFVIPMSGSGHGASKAWMTLQNRKVVPGTDLKSASYGYIYRMKLQFRTNDQGDWFMWSIADENDEPTLLTDPAVYRMARQIEDDFNKGRLKAQSMTDDQIDHGGEGGDRGTNERGQHDHRHI